MHTLLDMVAPEGVPAALSLHELSFGASGALPRSEWSPPQHALMAGDRDLGTASEQAEQDELEQAWAPTVRMGL